MTFFWLILYLVVLYLRPGEWIPFFYSWRLVPLVTAGSLFFLAFTLALRKTGAARVPHTRMMLGLFAAIVASHVSHLYLGGAMSAATGFAANLVIFFLVANVVDSPRKFQTILWTLIALTVLIAVQGIQQAQHGVGWAGQGLSQDARITWVGIFEDPNDLALAFVIVVPLLMSSVMRRSFIGLKWVPLVLLGVLIYGIFLTNSRGGMLALAVAIAFFFIKRSKWRVAGGLVGGALVAALLLFGPSRLHLMSATEDSAAGRLDAWYYGFQLLKHNPLFGVGYNMFTDDYPLTAHNSFVLAFSELGLVGFFFWIGLIYTTFRGLSRLQRHTDPWIASNVAGLQASLVGFCAAAFFLSRTYTMIPYLLIALCAALSNIAQLRTPEFTFKLNGTDTRNILMLCLGMLVLLQVAMKTWL